MSVKTRLHNALHRVGLDVVPYNGRYFSSRRRAEILDALGVDHVIDVGANEGQFGRDVRREGYLGPITSFEPLSDAFERLMKTCDDSWNAHRMALGAAPGKATLHRSRNSWSSSLFPITARHIEASPDAQYVGMQEVEVRTLDSFRFGGKVYLKIDTQGSEHAVLEGAEQTLDRAVVALELELSTTTLYENQALIGDVLNKLHARGFVVLSLTPAFVHPGTREVLQLDGIFGKRDHARLAERTHAAAVGLTTPWPEAPRTNSSFVAPGKDCDVAGGARSILAAIRGVGPGYEPQPPGTRIEVGTAPKGAGNNQFVFRRPTV